MACDIPLEISWWKATTLLQTSLQSKVYNKVMSLQSCKSPNFWNFGTLNWESWDKWHLDAGLMARHWKYYKGGRWWRPQSSGHGEFCEFVFAHGSCMHQKCSSYALTNLLFGLWRFVWVIDLLVNLPSPILELQHTHLPSKCCQPNSAPQLLLF